MKSKSSGFFILMALCILSACEPRKKAQDLSVISADGVEIHYKVNGNGSPAIVFVHGWSCDMKYWKEQTPFFSKDYTVVTIDLAGHGESGLERESWTMTAFGKDVAAVIKKLDLESVILVGHSMGGPVIVEASLQIPDRVIGLVGVDTFNELDLERTPEEVTIMVKPFKEDFSETTKAFVKSSFFVAESDSLLIENISSDMAAAPPRVAIPAARNLLLWKANDRLPKVQVPIKLINSDYQPTDLNATERYGIETLTMSGVGHFIMLEDPQTFNTLLDNEIREFKTTTHNPMN